MAKVASPDSGKQTSNRLEPDWNPDEMALAAKTVERIAAGWKDRSRAVQMLQALCGLAAGKPDRLKPDQAAQDWGFYATNLGEELRRRGHKIPGVDGWADDPDTAKGQRQRRRHRSAPNRSSGIPSPGHLWQSVCALDVRPRLLPRRLGRKDLPQRLLPAADLHRSLVLAGDRGQ